MGRAGRPCEARGRAWSHHPFGANGLLAKAGEHVPLLADGLVCLHKYRGQSKPQALRELKKLVQDRGGGARASLFAPEALEQGSEGL